MWASSLWILEEILIEINQDIAHKDHLLEQYNLDAFLDCKSEWWQSCFLNQNFTKSDRLKYIVKSHGWCEGCFRMAVESEN